MYTHLIFPFSNDKEWGETDSVGTVASIESSVPDPDDENDDR